MTGPREICGPSAAAARRRRRGAHARRARETKRDQDQGIDFVRIRSQKQENNRTEQADWQQPSASASSGPCVLGSRPLYEFMVRSRQDATPGGRGPPEFPPIDRKRTLGSIASDDGLCPKCVIREHTVKLRGRVESRHSLESR